MLVHCFGGRSRSAAFIAAYLMCHCGWSYESTIEVIVTARPVASVNKGFEKQLRAYALTNFDIYATQQVLLRNRIKALHSIRALNESKSSQGGSWRERERERDGLKGPGGNKRSWADRESLSARGVSLGEETEEGDEELDADEDIESEKGDDFLPPSLHCRILTEGIWNSLLSYPLRSVFLGNVNQHALTIPILFLEQAVSVRLMRVGKQCLQGVRQSS